MIIQIVYLQYFNYMYFKLYIYSFTLFYIFKCLYNYELFTFCSQEAKLYTKNVEY